MAAAAMLEQEDTLPGAQAEPAVIDRDGKAGLGQGGPDVRGGIVCPFQCVPVPALVFGHFAFVEGFHIRLGGGIIALADGQRGAGMRDVQEAQTFMDIPALNELFNVIGDGQHALAVGPEFESVF